MERENIIREFVEEDMEDILDIFNVFVEGFAVYCETKLNIEYLKGLLEKTKIILVLQASEKVIGFGYISSYHPCPSFNSTGVLTYFILPEYTGKGLGTELFNRLISKGKEIGITNYLAHVSSKNLQSLNFHKKHGFIETGKFKEICTKFNETIDVVWFQKQFK